MDNKESVNLSIEKETSQLKSKWSKNDNHVAALLPRTDISEEAAWLEDAQQIEHYDDIVYASLRVVKNYSSKMWLVWAGGGTDIWSLFWFAYEL